MVWCQHCGKNRPTHHDDNTGSECCFYCGKVVSQALFAEDPGFVKDAGGGAHLAGNMVKMSGDCSESHRRTLEKGNVIVDELIGKYGIQEVDHAKRYYQIAVERGFTRGRRTNQVAAACLYVACREKEKPFLLIEFSSELGVSVYELGTVYLLLCQLLSLQNHPFVQKPVDPSLFMHRYTSGLIKGKDNITKVTNTALQLAVSMKRDWIQTGRKPSGICAAAIYVSSVLHGFNFSRVDVVKTVHICEATLTKRLIEFESTKTGSLTIEEFTEHAAEFEKEMQSQEPCRMPGSKEAVCGHKSKAVQSGFGLCKDCYLEFCGGLDGSEPPAFQRAEIQRLEKANQSVVDDMSLESTSSGVDFDPTHQKTTHNQNQNGTTRPKAHTKENDIGSSLKDVQCSSPTTGKVDNTEDTFESQKDDSAPAASVDETHTLKEIADSEVDCYLNNEEERRFKKIIWEQMNKEYMQEQAIKEATAAAELKLYTSGTSEEIQEAQALAAAAAEALKSKKEKDKKRRAMEAKNAKPASTPVESVTQLFTKKKLSSKLDYDKLNSLFEEPSPKKKRFDDENDGGDDEGNCGEGEEEDNNDERNSEHEHETNGGGYGYDYDGNEYDEEEE